MLTVKEVREIVTERVIDCKGEKVLSMEVERTKNMMFIKTIVKGTHDRVYLYKHTYDGIFGELYNTGFYECNFNNC